MPPICWSLSATDRGKQPAAEIVIGIEVGLRKGDHCTERDLREHDAERQRRAGAVRNPCRGARTRVEHQTPEQDAVEDHAPIHHRIEPHIDHRAEMHRRDQPEIKQPDKQERRHQGLLQHPHRRHDVTAFRDAPQTLRHAALDRAAGAAERDQERPQMMHHDMLDAVQKKHVLRPVFEPRLQHGVSGDGRGENAAAPDAGRSAAARGETAKEPQQRQRRRQILAARNPTAPRTASAPDGCPTARTATRPAPRLPHRRLRPVPSAAHRDARDSSSHVCSMTRRARRRFAACQSAATPAGRLGA